MRILMVSASLPHPLLSGGQVRLFNLLRELSSRHDITLVCEKRSTQTELDIAAVQSHCSKVIVVPRRKQWAVRNVVRSGFSTRSFLTNGHTQHAMRQAIAGELAAAPFSVIHVETFYVLHNLPRTELPVVLVEQNVEYDVYGRYQRRAPRLLRPLMAIDVAKMRREEERSWAGADALIAVSDADAQVMRSAGFEPVVVPNGVNTDEFARKDVSAMRSKTEKRVLFIGDFRWLQNRDSARFILEEVWPALRRRSSDHDVKLWIVARRIPESITRLAGSTDVILDEESSARPTPEIFRDAWALLAPIRVGGGTSYKILESMACGTPVVTMELSAGSLGARDGQELLVGQTGEDLAGAVARLLADAQLYERISAGGSAFIERRFAWKAIARTLDDVYTRTVQDRSAAARPAGSVLDRTGPGGAT